MASNSVVIPISNQQKLLSQWWPLSLLTLIRYHMFIWPDNCGCEPCSWGVTPTLSTLVKMFSLDYCCSKWQTDMTPEMLTHFHNMCQTANKGSFDWKSFILKSLRLFSVFFQETFPKWDFRNWNTCCSDRCFSFPPWLKVFLVARLVGLGLQEISCWVLQWRIFMNTWQRGNFLPEEGPLSTGFLCLCFISGLSLPLACDSWGSDLQWLSEGNES